jgi:hypothetical protein
MMKSEGDGEKKGVEMGRRAGDRGTRRKRRRGE